MLELLLFEELLRKDLDKEVISLLGAMYEGEAIKGVHELLKDATPFKIAASIITFLILYWYIYID